ncbi:MAG: hypothetical protein ACYCRH_01675 [Acidiferrobacteraceae bacterium]
MPRHFLQTAAPGRPLEHPGGWATLSSPPHDRPDALLVHPLAPQPPWAG